MEFLIQLWMPIVLSSVLVFIVSSIIHMATPMHKGDFKKLSNEGGVMESVRLHGVEPGTYMFPLACSMKDMGSPEMVAKIQRGPVGWLTIAPPGGCNLGKSLICWFIYSLIVSLLVAYVSWYGLGAGANYLSVFRVAGGAAILGYSLGHMHDPIWKGGSWTTACKFVFDGIVYGLVTAGTFGWLWPN